MLPGRSILRAIPAACLESCHIEQVIGECAQALRRQVEAHKHLLLPRGKLWFFAACSLNKQRLRKVPDDGNGITQFMRGDTDKVVLLLFGLLAFGDILCLLPLHCEGVRVHSSLSSPSYIYDVIVIPKLPCGR